MNGGIPLLPEVLHGCLRCGEDVALVDRQAHGVQFVVEGIDAAGSGISGDAVWDVVLVEIPDHLWRAGDGFFTDVEDAIEVEEEGKDVSGSDLEHG